MRSLSACVVGAILLAATVVPRHLHASTAAFGGVVTAVGECPPNARGCRRTFTVKIDYYDYVSWSSFGRHSKVGETITRRVKKTGTAGVINGRLVDSATFARAIQPGQWGYFYEDTWLNLQVTPNFHWGEVVKHDAARGTFDLRIHRTDKDHHIETNPHVVETMAYDGETAFRIEERDSRAAQALQPGHWVQIHEPRPQTILVWTKDAAFDAGELLPQEEGRRGFANDLTRPAALKAYRCESPEDVIDVPVELTVAEKDGTDTTVDSRKLTLVLDGKVCPIAIGFRPGRAAVLCYYRKEKAPHKVFVRSFDRAVRGNVAGVKGGVVRMTSGEGDATVELDDDVSVWLDGRKSALEAALQAGRTIEVHPGRGRTIVAFPPHAPAEP